MAFKTEIIEIIQRTPNVKSFQFSRPKPFDYKAGQYLIIVLADPKGSIMKNPLTISSSPTEDFLEVTKKITAGHEFSEAISSLTVGDEVQLDGPFGQFILDPTQNKIAMLSGGIGITPFRSMCRYSTDSKLKTDIFLCYGNKTSEDIVFKQEFDQMKKQNPHFNIVHTLSRQDSNWKGHTGRIDSNMIQQEIPDYTQRLFYLCGPPGMVKAMENLLNELGIVKKQIVVEKFGTN
jgi:ferredoxin-NADP reductase